MGVHLLSYTIQDADGKTKSVVIPMADTEAIADIQTFVTNHSALLDACLDGIITKAAVSYALTLPGGLNDTPANDSHVEEGGLFAFNATGTSYRKSIYVPAYAKSLIANSGDIANAGDTAAWITDLLSGTEVSPTDNFENVLASFLSGTLKYRK